MTVGIRKQLCQNITLRYATAIRMRSSRHLYIVAFSELFVNILFHLLTFMTLYDKIDVIKNGFDTRKA